MAIRAGRQPDQKQPAQELVSIRARKCRVYPGHVEQVGATKAGAPSLWPSRVSSSHYQWRVLTFLVQPLGDLLGVAFVVEFQEAGEDFAAGGFADRKADALLRLVEPVAKVQIRPAVGRRHGIVHLDVQFSELLDVFGGFVGS